MLGKLAGLCSTLFVLTCAATVTAQLVGVGILASRGMLTGDKCVRYAGVLYGLEPLDMAPGKEPATQPVGMKREDAMADRVRKMPEIADRQLAVRKGSDDIRGVVLDLKIERNQQDTDRKVFDSYLKELETNITSGALREIHVTLESLPPKQAKDIIRSMLTDPTNDPNDDVMADVVAIVKSMPADKTKKIFGELKTEEERELLHRILVEIGRLDEPTSQLTGKQP